MSSNNNQQNYFPAVPPSLSAGGYEMRDDYPAQETLQPMLDQESYLTPYLGLRARLSQVWINRWTILLLLVLIRTLIACASLDDGIGSARTQALSACSGVESVGSAMASMPHYLSQGVNELAANGVEKAVNGLMDMLSLTVTGVEELVVFAVNLLTSTYLCLITLAVSGSLHISIDLLEEATGFLNKTLGDIGKAIEGDVNSFEGELNKISADISSGINSILGGSVKMPTLDLNSSLTALNNVQLPSSLNAGLQTLNGSIPTFSQVQAFADNAVRLPFEEVKKLIEESTGNYTVDSTLFPVPGKEQLTFCSDNNGINDFFNSLVEIANVARKIFLGVLLVLAVLVCIPMAYREIRRWRLIQERAQIIRKNAYDPIDVVYISSRPYTASAGMAVASKFQSTRRQVLTRWIVAYATSTPALYVLSLGIAGLAACLCQYVLLQSIKKEVPALTNQVEAFADKVVHSLENASEQWAIATNDMINGTSNKINEDVFGWVNTTSHGLNNTLNTFVDEMTTVLNSTFGGTILYDPITEVFNCLITLKIVGIEKGLTWVSDNAHVDFPLFPNNIFSLGAANSISNSTPSANFLANSQSDASDEISAAVVTLVNKLQDSIRTEAIISACIVGIWFAIVLIGFIRATMLFFGRDKIYQGYDSTSCANGPRQSYGITTSAADLDQHLGHSRASSTEALVEKKATQHSAAAYTLQPRPFPSINVVAPYEPSGSTNYGNEKVGYAGARPVHAATERPNHVRKSSYANLKVSTPAVDTHSLSTFEKMGH